MSVGAVELSDEPYAVVAMGTDGILRRTPNGEWERRAVLGVDPHPLWIPSWVSWLRGAPLFTMFLALVVSSRDERRSNDLSDSFLTLNLIGGLVLFLGLAFLFWWFWWDADYYISGPVTAVASLGLFAISLVVARRKEPPEVDPPEGPSAETSREPV